MPSSDNPKEPAEHDEAHDEAPEEKAKHKKAEHGYRAYACSARAIPEGNKPGAEVHLADLDDLARKAYLGIVAEPDDPTEDEQKLWKKLKRYFDNHGTWEGFGE